MWSRFVQSADCSGSTFASRNDDVIISRTVLQIAYIDDSKKINDNNIIQVKLDVLENILRKVGDREVVIISLNGRMRKGKSFICTNFLKYFLYGSNGKSKKWIYKSLNEAFVWKEDTERVTCGIHMFDEPMIVSRDGKETAVLVMDCQGLFDNQTLDKGNALLFTFSVLLSSIFVFNDTETTKDVFEQMNLFMLFAKSVREVDNRKLLQKFVYLVRDWNNQNIYKCGFYDSQVKPTDQDKNLMDFLFGESENQRAEVKTTRRAICDLSAHVSVFAMCHPKTNPDPHIKPTQWKREFRDQVVAFIHNIVSPDSMKDGVKMIGGNVITGTDLIGFVRLWVEALKKSVDLPDIQSIMQATSDLLCKTCVEKCFEKYESGIRGFIARNPNGIAADVFEQEHNKFLVQALKLFNNSKLLGGEKVQKLYEQKLR